MRSITVKIDGSDKSIDDSLLVAKDEFDYFRNYKDEIVNNKYVVDSEAEDAEAIIANNEAIQKQIEVEESKITQRTMREFAIGTESEKLTAVAKINECNEAIQTLRGQLQ